MSFYEISGADISKPASEFKRKSFVKSSTLFREIKLK